MSGLSIPRLKYVKYIRHQDLKCISQSFGIKVIISKVLQTLLRLNKIIAKASNYLFLGFRALLRYNNLVINIFILLLIIGISNSIESYLI